MLADYNRVIFLNLKDFNYAKIMHYTYKNVLWKTNFVLK